MINYSSKDILHCERQSLWLVCLGRCLDEFSCNCIAFGIDTEAAYLFSAKTCLNTEPFRAWCFSVVCSMRCCFKNIKKCNKSKYLKTLILYGVGV